MMRFLFEKGLNSQNNAPTSSQSRCSNDNTHDSKENSIEEKIKWFSEVLGNCVVATIPIVTVSEANGGKKVPYLRKNGKIGYKTEHWTEKARRHKNQKKAIHFLLNPLKANILTPCHITLTRLAPDKLDRFDNLPMSLKWILDAVCEVITGDLRPGRADASDLIADVKYEQVQTSKIYGVKITICSQ